MISLKPLILEGRYDALVTQLARRLLQVVKDSYAAVSDPQGEFAGEKIYFTAQETVPNIDDDNSFKHIYFEEVENKTIPLDFYLQLKVQWIENFDDFRKGGDAYNETTRNGEEVPLIELRLELDPDEYPKILSQVAMEMRDTLRHEIEHLTQSGWNTKNNKFMPSDLATRQKIQSGKLPAFRYFTLPKEVDANIQGLYYQAKKQRTPFKTVANNYLDLFVPDMMTPEQKELVLDVWRSRLPALAIRQEL
jgi:hypothetical protein